VIPEPERLYGGTIALAEADEYPLGETLPDNARALTKSERAIFGCTGFHCAILLRGYHGTGRLLISKWQSWLSAQ